MVRTARDSPRKEVMNPIFVLAAILLAAMVVIVTVWLLRRDPLVEAIGRMKEEVPPPRDSGTSGPGFLLWREDKGVYRSRQD